MRFALKPFDDESLPDDATESKFTKVLWDMVNGHTSLIMDDGSGNNGVD